MSDAELVELAEKASAWRTLSLATPEEFVASLVTATEVMQVVPELAEELREARRLLLEQAPRRPDW